MRPRCGHEKGVGTCIHSTGNRQKCPQPYTRQDTLVHEFAATLSELIVSTSALDWLQETLAHTDKAERAERETTRKRYRAERDRLSARLDRRYDDRVDNSIPKETSEQKASTIKNHQATLEAKTSFNTTATPLETAIDTLRLTSSLPGIPGTTPQRRTQAPPTPDLQSHLAGRTIALQLCSNPSICPPIRTNKRAMATMGYQGVNRIFRFGSPSWIRTATNQRPER